MCTFFHHICELQSADAMALLGQNSYKLLLHNTLHQPDQVLRRVQTPYLQEKELQKNSVDIHD